MSVLQIEFDLRFYCEAYPKPGETPADVLKRGDFQHGVPVLLRYRLYELDDGEPCNFSEWTEIESKIELWCFYE